MGEPEKTQIRPFPSCSGSPLLGRGGLFLLMIIVPMLSHADNTEDPAPQAASSNALRSQRLSPDEARAVIDLWQAELVEQTGLTDRPAVPDVAEGLDLSVEDVQRLLAEVRTRREAESRLLAQEQELAEIRLAEEQRKLAEIQRQRAELGRVVAEAERQETDRWRRPVTMYRPMGAKPKRSDAAAWTGDEAFWQETDADKEYRAQFRTRRRRTLTVAAIGVIALLVLLSAVSLFGAMVHPAPPPQIYDYR